MSRRHKATVALAGLALLLSLLSAPVSAVTVRHAHSGMVNNLNGGACDISWKHVNYTDDSASAWTDERSSCQWVEVRARLYQWGLGYVTVVGPQQNLFSSVASGDVLSILWSQHCGSDGIAAGCIQPS